MAASASSSTTAWLWPTAQKLCGIRGAIGFVESIQRLCEPKEVVWCDGSEREDLELKQQLVASGAGLPLNPAKRPNSFLFRSDPRDVARSEASTFVCPDDPEDAGSLNNWRQPSEMRDHLRGLFRGCMRGRTMYVVPFRMGPHGSPMSRVGVQVTDSAYVVISTRIMARMGKRVSDDLVADDGLAFLPCVHSVGAPDPQPGETWPCDPDRRCVAHFPQEPSVWSYGSGYGGNALLGKKCFALRLGSAMGREEGWLAEHCLILGVRGPGMDRRKYLCAGFPSACGKTNLAMLSPEASSMYDKDKWSVTCVGDDIAWIFPDEEKGGMRAINPEAGFFGVAPGTSGKTNPHAMAALERDALFTNVALTEDGDVWWEGMTDQAPSGTLIDWRGQPWRAGESQTPAAHPNARYTVSAASCPVIDEDWDSPEGVPIDAFLFGGRRPDTVPLARECASWAHGLALASAIGSATTAAQDEGQQGAVRRDPFAMRPFFGYALGDYLAHWLRVGEMCERASGGGGGGDDKQRRPKIFLVNWFQKDPETGRFLWPGFGENARVLRWVCARTTSPSVASAALAPFRRSVPSAIGGGFLPRPDAIADENDSDRLGGDESDGQLPRSLFEEDAELWAREAKDMERFLRHEGAVGETQADRVPAAIWNEIRALRARAEAAAVARQ